MSSADSPHHVCKRVCKVLTAMKFIKKRRKRFFLLCVAVVSNSWGFLYEVSASKVRAGFLSGVSTRGNEDLARKKCCGWSSKAFDTDLFIPTMNEEDSVTQDVRPHEQRATRPRGARRMNQPFRYLYRHDVQNQTLRDNMTSMEFLMSYGGYTKNQVLEMNRSFPPLLDLDVRRHLRPKMRFLQETVCGMSGNQTEILSEELRQMVPPQYFGARLERTVAPRHAFLVYNKLPHGQRLLQETGHGTTLWQDFLLSCRKSKRFCALCNQWSKQYGTPTDSSLRITAKQVEAFEALFARGLMAVSRNELCQPNNTWPLEHISITSGELVPLLVQHGANPIERDVRGVSLLHWAAGTGNVGALEQLMPYFSKGAFTEAARDGATIFHWAAAGAKSREFGCGGHIDVCRYLLTQVKTGDTKRLVNSVTKDGNSVLHWAAWSGTLNVVKLLIRNLADPRVANRNGCTVAHWAASGGNLEVCRYLKETVKVDFSEANSGGNTPLTHAVAFGRVEVVEWLQKEVCDPNDSVALDLAKDFVCWTAGEDLKRNQILGLFQDWFGYDDSSTFVNVDEREDDNDYY